MNKPTFPYGLLLVLLTFVSLATWHSVIVPITQGEDELAHFRYLSFVAETGRLPIDDTERERAWYRSDWPPLYHLLVGWTVSRLDTTQPVLKEVGDSSRRLLVGQIVYPRLIIYTEDAVWPWRDGLLAWHIGRFISIAFAVGALLITHRTAFEWAQATPTLPLSPTTFATLTTALLAFIPRFGFTSAMLSDDSLFILLSALVVWLLLRALRGDDRLRIYALIGLLLGLSIATKYSTGLLPLLIVPLLIWRKWQRATALEPAAIWTWRPVILRVVICWLSVLLGSSWWFAWIGYHFNTVNRDGWLLGLLHPLLASGPDVSMRRVFAFFTGERFSAPIRPDAISEGTWLGWLSYLFQTFWSVPILEVDPLFPLAHLLMLLVCGASLLGLIHFWRISPTQSRAEIALFVAFVALLIPFPVLRFQLTYNILETGQGRHILYPAAQTIPLLLMLGWLTFNYQSATALALARKLPARAKQISLSLLPLALLLWTIIQLGLMQTTYPDPLPVRTTPPPQSNPIWSASAELPLHLLDYHLNQTAASLDLTLHWQASEPPQQNYRLLTELVDTSQTTWLHWQSHPVAGLYPTRAWDAGDIVRDHLRLPTTHLPDGTYQLRLHWLPQAAETPLGEPLTLATVTINQPDDEATPFYTPFYNEAPPFYDEATPFYRPAPPPVALSNPRPTSLPAELPPTWTSVEANFGDQLSLRGYSLPQRRFAIGQPIPLTLYWQSLAPVLSDTLTFAVLLNQADQQAHGQVDRYPLWFYNPILWVEGEVVEDAFQLSTAPTAPPGVYFIHVGQYYQTSNGATSLPLMQDGQPTDSTAVRIGPLKIGQPQYDFLRQPDEARFAEKVAVTWGDQITLLGYDVALTATQLDLTLYWQAEAAPSADYTTFVHVRTLDTDETVAQHDQPPTGGVYPTGLWDAGEIVVDNLTVPLGDVPPGGYRLLVGLYEPRTGQRLTLPQQPDNALMLQHINR